MSVEALSAKVSPDEFHRSRIPTPVSGGITLVQTEEVRLAGNPENVADHVLEQDGSVPTWGRGAYRLRQRLDADSSHTARFTEQWARQMWGSLLEFDRACRDWAVSTMLLTFTGSPWLSRENELPLFPVTHLDHLTGSDAARRSALSRALNCNYQTKTVVGVHESGYCHLHTGVWTDEEVSSEQLEPVVQAHINNCPIAAEAGNGVGAISIRNSAPTEDEPSALIGYLGHNVPGLMATEGGVRAEPRSRVHGATVLDAAGKKVVR